MRFGLPAALLCLITAGPAFCDDSSRPPIPISSQTEDFPAFGVTLSSPPGWTRDRSPGGNRVARWLKFDAQGKPEALLEVDFERTTLTNTQEWQHLSNDLHAASLRTMRTGGNLEGAWVKGSFEKGGATATQMFVISRDTTLYTAALVHRTPPTPSVAAADDALMQDFIVHWTWRDVDEPSSHLALLEKPFPALGGLVTLSVPAIAQLINTDDARTHMQFQVTNLKTHIAEMNMELNLQSTPMPDLQQVGEIVKSKMHLEQDLEWTNVAGKGSISQWAKTSREANPYWVLFGGIKMDETHSILISCTLYRPEAAVQRAYLEAIKNVVANVKPVGGNAVAEQNLP